MNEKNEAGLNELDMQAAIADWVIANDGCEGMLCINEEGMFKGTECPLFKSYRGCTINKSIVSGMKEWLKKYHKQKDEAEKLKSEAARKQEQEKQEQNNCGNCKHSPEFKHNASRTIVQCSKNGVNVPYCHTCCDFEQRADANQNPVQDEGNVNASAFAERIAQLEVENANLKSEIRKCNEKVSLSTELSWKCERLTEQRNMLSNGLIKATLRVKELEWENSTIAQKLVNCAGLSSTCADRDRLIDQLREENAELRGKLGQAEDNQKRELRRMIELEIQLSKALGDQWLNRRLVHTARK